MSLYLSLNNILLLTYENGAYYYRLGDSSLRHGVNNNPCCSVVREDTIIANYCAVAGDSRPEIVTFAAGSILIIIYCMLRPLYIAPAAIVVPLSARILKYNTGAHIARPLYSYSGK